MKSLFPAAGFPMEAIRATAPDLTCPGVGLLQLPGPNPRGRRIMLDVLLDCFGVFALIGQAVLFLVYGEIETPAS
jgi:hypothetical protein